MSYFSTEEVDNLKSLRAMVTEDLMNEGPHLMGATLSTLLRAVHPGTIAMTSRVIGNSTNPDPEWKRGRY